MYYGKAWKATWKLMMNIYPDIKNPDDCNIKDT